MTEPGENKINKSWPSDQHKVMQDGRSKTESEKREKRRERGSRGQGASWRKREVKKGPGEVEKGVHQSP